MKVIGVKRYEKYNIIFKYCFEWIILYYEKKLIFDNYRKKILLNLKNIT